MPWRNCSKASFCVIGQDQIVLEKYTSLYRSVVAFGKIRILEEDAKKRDAIERLAVRYNPDADASEIDEAIRKDWEPPVYAGVYDRTHDRQGRIGAGCGAPERGDMIMPGLYLKKNFRFIAFIPISSYYGELF